MIKIIEINRFPSLKNALWVFLPLFALLVSGCSSSRPEALPEEHAKALPWGAIDLDINKSGPFTLKTSFGKVIEDKAKLSANSEEKVPLNILTLSGGGTRGAFGAGVIEGWHDKGNMPKFDVVTGVSTGAVMATFIFIGGEELDEVKRFYTTSSTDDIYTTSWWNFIGNAYIKNPEPLKKLFAANFNEELLNKVAAEHANGRRLYIATTNLDSGTMTVWDMGEIASSDRADKYQRFADIVYASSAMPLVLPPQYMSVNVGDQQYHQMHIDGGIYSNVFMIGLMVHWDKVLNLPDDLKANLDANLYTVANRKYRNRSFYDPVEQSPAKITKALVNVEMDLLFDRSIYRLYESSQERGINFNMMVVPNKLNFVDDGMEFDPDKMSQLYKAAYQIGLEGIPWQTEITMDEYIHH